MESKNVVSFPEGSAHSTAPVWHQRQSVRIGEIASIIALIGGFFGFLLGFTTRVSLIEERLVHAQRDISEMGVSPNARVGMSMVTKARVEAIEERLRNFEDRGVAQDKQILEISKALTKVYYKTFGVSP